MSNHSLEIAVPPGPVHQLHAQAIVEVQGQALEVQMERAGLPRSKMSFETFRQMLPPGIRFLTTGSSADVTKSTHTVLRAARHRRAACAAGRAERKA